MRKLLAKILFWLHFVVVLIWIGLFFVPEHLWQNKTSFHFYFTLLIAGHQFLWGAFLLPWTKEYHSACFLTTMSRLLEGYKITDPKNYRHSCVSEFFEMIGYKMPSGAVTLLLFLGLFIVTFQFLFLK